jgi:hypothetical protein
MSMIAIPGNVRGMARQRPHRPEPPEPPQPRAADTDEGYVGGSANIAMPAPARTPSTNTVAPMTPRAIPARSGPRIPP